MASACAGRPQARVVHGMPIRCFQGSSRPSAITISNGLCVSLIHIRSWGSPIITEVGDAGSGLHQGLAGRTIKMAEADDGAVLRQRPTVGAGARRDAKIPEDAGLREWRCGRAARSVPLPRQGRSRLFNAAPEFVHCCYRLG